MTAVTEHLSILFADLLGSVRLYERLPRIEAQLMVERYLKRIRVVIEGFSGQVISTQGDELMAVFQDPANACQAAIEMQKRIGDLPPVSAVKLAIRIGVSYGSACRTDEGYAGEAYNLAACLAGTAKPGQILTNQLTVAALPSSIKSIAKEYGEISINRSQQKTTAFELQIPRLTYRPTTEKAQYKIAEKGKSHIPSLRLRYLDKLVILDESKQIIKIGRNPGNDILIQAPLASRNHAHIKRLEENVILVDHSQNGTYIKREGEPEVFVCNNQLLLYGTGTISFGASIRTQIADFIEFDFFDPSDKTTAR